MFALDMTKLLVDSEYDSSESSSKFYHLSLSQEFNFMNSDDIP